MRSVALLAIGATSALGVALGVGCRASSAAAAPCNEDPFQCGAGETCWPQECTCPSSAACDPTDCTPRFQCAASADRRPGDSCRLDIGSVGCGDLQTCVAIAGSGVGGVCRYYCDPTAADRGCATGFTCVRLGVGSSSTATENVCLPTQSDADASLTVGAPGADDGGYYDPDALPIQPDATPDSGQHTM
jgi:hypothetical protein